MDRYSPYIEYEKGPNGRWYFDEDVDTRIQELEDENERLRNNCRTSEERKEIIFEQSEEIARLRKALGFYADERHYEVLDTTQDGIQSCSIGVVLTDRGKRATEALKEGEDG